MRCHLALMIVFGLAIPAPLGAWHKDGHMAVARVAWQELSKEQKGRCTQILKAHVHDDIDHYKVFLAADRPTKSDVQIGEDEWAFARAATWPDWVRDPGGQTSGL